MSRLVIVAMSCVLFGGCSSGDSTSRESREGAPSAGESASSPAPSVVPSGDVSEGQPESQVRGVSDAKPVPAAALELIDTVPIIQGGANVQVLAVDAAGAVLYSRAPVTEGVELAQRELMLRDSDGNATRFSATPRPEQPGQIIGAAFNDRYAVWMETSSIELGKQAWVLYGYTRADSTVRLLARSRRLGSSPPPAVPGYTGPVLAGDRVFWAQAGGTPRALQSDIMGCQVIECAPQIVMTGAAYPAVANRQVYAVANDRFAGDEVSPEMVIQSVPAAGGSVSVVRTVELSPTQFPNGLAAGGAGLVWLILDSAGPDQANVWFANTEEVQTVESDSNGTFAFPVAADDYLAWAEGSGSAEVANFVVDATGALYSLGTTGSLYGLLGAGDVVVWRDKSDPRRGLDGANIEFRIARFGLP